jgi:hypothetical protein
MFDTIDTLVSFYCWILGFAAPKRALSSKEEPKIVWEDGKPPAHATSIEIRTRGIQLGKKLEKREKRRQKHLARKAFEKAIRKSLSRETSQALRSLRSTN